MTTHFPLYTPGALATALQRLCGTLDAHGMPPKTGAFVGEAIPMESIDDLRQRLEEWIGSGATISGWLLTTEALHVYPLSTGLPGDIPLHAELYRASDDASLNLRQTSKGWNWEELKNSPDLSDGSRFVEQKCVLSNPSHVPVALGKRANYQIEWALTEAPGSSSPVTFRPARSRFVGWSNNPI